MYVNIVYSSLPLPYALLSLLSPFLWFSLLSTTVCIFVFIYVRTHLYANIYVHVCTEHHIVIDAILCPHILLYIIISQTLVLVFLNITDLLFYFWRKLTFLILSFLWIGNKFNFYINDVFFYILFYIFRKTYVCVQSFKRWPAMTFEQQFVWEFLLFLFLKVKRINHTSIA